MTRAAPPTLEVHLDAGLWQERIARELAEGLSRSPKEISPIWFYDARGSALFEAITKLDGYYLTRAERSLLRAHASDIAGCTRASMLVELGAGAAEKTRLLLDALVAVGSLECYVPFDVDETMVRSVTDALTTEYPGVAVHGVVGDFGQHLQRIPDGERRLVAFLGSTIGNLPPSERRRFLFDLDCAMRRDDSLLLGVDLVKDPDVLLAAYDDLGGVTAEFNRNALRVVNHRMGADFEPDAFDHVARWDADQQWMELSLRSRRAQAVHVTALDLTVEFAEGEELRTEISAKFTTDGITAELWEAGFVVEQTWVAGEDEFALLLARPYC